MEAKVLCFARVEQGEACPDHCKPATQLVETERWFQVDGAMSAPFGYNGHS